MKNLLYDERSMSPTPRARFIRALSDQRTLLTNDLDKELRAATRAYRRSRTGSPEREAAVAEYARVSRAIWEEHRRAFAMMDVDSTWAAHLLAYRTTVRRSLATVAAGLLAGFAASIFDPPTFDAMGRTVDPWGAAAAGMFLSGLAWYAWAFFRAEKAAERVAEAVLAQSPPTST